MKKLLKLAALIVPAFLLNGCATYMDVLWFNSYVDEPNSSVIIIGNYSKYRLLKVSIERNGKGIALSPRLPISPPINAAAFKVKVGDEIKITSVLYSAPELAKDDIHKYRYAGHSAIMKKPFTVNINKKGIYHVGTVFVKGKKVLISPKMPPQVLVMAKTNYKDIFSKLKPMNFK